MGMRLKSLLVVAFALALPPGSKSVAQQRAPAEVLPEKIMGAEFQSVDGSAPIRLSDYRGGVTVLAVWASWCGPCRLAVGGLSEFNKEFAGRGVVVVALTAEDPVNDAEAVRDFVEEAKPELRLGWVSREAAEALLKGKPSVPQIFVVSGEGVVVTKFVGWSDRVPRMLRESAEKALANQRARP